MVKLNQFLKDNTPRSNIIEWGTKEDCWRTVKEKFEIPDISSIKNDICSKEAISKRYEDVDSSDSEMDALCLQLVSSVSSETWTKIADWGKDSGCLSLPDQNTAKNLAHKTKFDYALNKRDIAKGFLIYEIVCRNNYELFDTDIKNGITDDSISRELIIKMLIWEKTPIVLEGWQLKIIQQSVNNNYISRFRTAELNLLRQLLSNHGF